VLRALPAEARELAPRRMRRTPRQLWWGLAITLLAAAGVAAFLLLRTDHGGARPAVAPPPPPPRALKIVTAKDFDPVATGGGGAEHPTEVLRAIDGDRASFWSTETYTGGNLGAKPGVGLYVTADSQVAARQLEVQSPTPGWRAQIYAAPTAPAPTLAGWGKPIAQLDATDRKTTVELHTPAGARFRSYLIWIVKLPPAGQVQLSEVRLLG
jgi:hypothetical protein